MQLSIETFLESLILFTKRRGARLLFTSRDVHDIRDHIVTSLNPSDHLVFELQMTKQDTQADILSFSNSLMQRRLPNKPDQLKEELATAAADKCEGMFLWLRLLHDQLGPGKNGRQLHKIVSDTPTGLDQAYQRDWQRIMNFTNNDDRARAFRILRWALFATRPLTVRELAEALLIQLDNDHTSYPLEDLPEAYDEVYISDQLKRLCGSLLEVRGVDESFDGAARVVQFPHFSVREFLTEAAQERLSDTGQISLSDSTDNNDLLAQLCLKYLCYDNLAQESLLTSEQIEEKLKQYAFLQYASQNWITHASRVSIPSPALIALSNTLHDPSGFRWRTYSELTIAIEHRHSPAHLCTNEATCTNPLYLSCLTGLKDTVKYVLDQGAPVNAVAGSHANALQRAACSGSLDIVELLLERGADPHVKGGKHGSALVSL